jgi:hypothetical protein
LKGESVDLEAIVTAGGSYFRGQKFLAGRLGSDPQSLRLLQAVGDAWWKGSTTFAPQLPDYTTGSSLRSTFLGSAVTARSDHVPVDGQDAVQLSGVRADVFIAEAPPYRLLRLRLKKGSVVDGIADADLRYRDFDRDFGIATPSGAIDFADLSTLPPFYSVVSVDTTSCGSTCLVTAMLKNLGGNRGARAPSTVSFTMTDPQTNSVVGTCTATVQPDVGYGATTNASCTIRGVNGRDHNAAVVTATAENPGHA